MPTAFAFAATLATSSWLVQFFSGGSIDGFLARNLLLAYMLFVPFYFFEQFYGELLTAHARSGLLFRASIAATYLITIPVAYVAVFHWQSAFWAILGKGIAVVLLAYVYWSQFRRRKPSGCTIRKV